MDLDASVICLGPAPSSSCQYTCISISSDEEGEKLDDDVLIVNQKGSDLPDNSTKEKPHNPTKEKPDNPTKEKPHNPTKEKPDNPKLLERDIIIIEDLPIADHDISVFGKVEKCAKGETGAKPETVVNPSSSIVRSVKYGKRSKQENSSKLLKKRKVDRHLTNDKELIVTVTNEPDCKQNETEAGHKPLSPSNDCTVFFTIDRLPSAIFPDHPSNTLWNTSTDCDSHSKTEEPSPSSQKRLRPISIDGSNVAMTHGKEEVFSCLGIKLCIDFFLKRGHTEIKAFVPRYRRSRSKYVKDSHILDELAKGKQFVVFTPSRRVEGSLITSYDDRFVIDYAVQNNGVIVSNDNYRDLIDESQEYKEAIQKRLLMFAFADDMFMIPQDPLGRNGPCLDTFLQLPE